MFIDLKALRAIVKKSQNAQGDSSQTPQGDSKRNRVIGKYLLKVFMAILQKSQSAQGDLFIDLKALRAIVTKSQSAEGDSSQTPQGDGKRHRATANATG